MSAANGPSPPIEGGGRAAFAHHQARAGAGQHAAVGIAADHRDRANGLGQRQAPLFLSSTMP
jgi:hypothetical protein